MHKKTEKRDLLFDSFLLFSKKKGKKRKRDMTKKKRTDKVELSGGHRIILKCVFGFGDGFGEECERL